MLRDREAFPVFVDALRSVEPAVSRTLERIAREVDLAVADRLAETVRKIFARVIKELSDLDNPMRTPVGGEAGEGGLLDTSGTEASAREDRAPEEPPTVEDLIPPSSQAERPAKEPPPEGQPGSRRRDLPSIAPDPDPGAARSRFDPDAGIVYYNERHADYLLVKEDESVLLDYLATLVAKEYVVYNNPRAATAELAEEMVRMLVRVRRHMPRAR